MEAEVTFTQEEFKELQKQVALTGGHMYMSFGNFLSGLGDSIESSGDANKEFKKLTEMLEKKER